MKKENNVIKENVKKRSQKYCLRSNRKVNYKFGKERANLFDIPRYKDVFTFIKRMENNIEEKLPISVELDFITLEALKIYMDENGDFSKLEQTLGINIFYLINDISLFHITKARRIIDDYLNDTVIKDLNNYYNNNLDIVLSAYQKNCSSLYIFDILERDKKYSLVNNIYDSIKEKDPLKRNIASQLILDFESQQCKSISEKGKEELCYKISRINKVFNSIDYNDFKNINISIDNVYDYLT